MDKKELEKFITDTFSKYMNKALERLELYVSGDLASEDFWKELEELINECNKELSNR
ncbi:MAG: hypothetical protein NC218_11775 [Acetobacter sp.]|nr:hypothetical protein [Acetobacter sp.]